MKTVVGLAAAAIMAGATAVAFAHRTPPPLAPIASSVQKLQFNTLAHTGTRLLTAGALGEIYFSDDQGQQWQAAQIDQPRQAMLLHVALGKDQKTGIAVGHEGWILRTTDGGSTWKEVGFDADNGEPLMASAELPNGQWLAVGSFGRALQSSDGGQTWSKLELPAEVEDKHMNRIVGSADGQQWIIVGERGLVVQSSDGGQTWAVTPDFYNGSLYNAMAMDGGGWLVYGMRGNIFTQAAPGEAWSRSTLGAPVSFFGHVRQADGTIVLVGQGGLMGISRDQGHSFELQKIPGRAALTDAVLVGDTQGIIASETGLRPFPPLQTAAAAKPQAGDAQ